MLFRLGDPPASAFVILQGEVEVARGGDPGPHEKLGPGQVVGEVALMVNRAQTAAAKALTDTTVAIITREAFLTALDSQRSVVNPFLKRLFETLHDVPSLVSKGAPPLVVVAERPQQTLRLYGSSPSLSEQMRPEGYPVTTLPFRVGRRADEGESQPPIGIELTLVDEKPYNLSRQHFAIEMAAAVMVVRDIWSQLGTTVNGVRIGRSHSQQSRTLEPGENTIIAGRPSSPFVFRLVVG